MKILKYVRVFFHKTRPDADGTGLFHRSRAAVLLEGCALSVLK